MVVHGGAQQRARNGAGMADVAAWMIDAGERPPQRVPVPGREPPQVLDRRRCRLLGGRSVGKCSREEPVGEGYLAEASRHAQRPSLLGPRTPAPAPRGSPRRPDGRRSWPIARSFAPRRFGQERGRGLERHSDLHATPMTSVWPGEGRPAMPAAPTLLLNAWDPQANRGVQTVIQVRAPTSVPTGERRSTGV